MKPTHLVAWLAQLAGLTVLTLLCIFPVESDDLFLNLKTGEVIWQQKALPMHDIFSYTVNHLEWINHEWITIVVIYLLYQLGGFNLLIIVKTVAIVFAFGILLWEARRWTNDSWLLTPLLILLTYTTSDRFIERAHIANMVMLALYLELLFRWRSGASWIAYLLPALSLLWINLHSGAIIGPLIMAAVMAADYLQRILWKSYPWLKHQEPASFDHLKKALIPLFLHLPALMMTPYSYRAVLYPLQQANWDIYRHYVYEWMPIYAPLYRHTPAFLAFLISCLVLVLALILNIRKIQLADVALAAFAIVIGQSAIRFTDVFCLLAFVVITRQFKGRRWLEDRGGKTVKLQLAATLIAVLCCTIIVKQGYVITIGQRKLGLGVSGFNYPTIPLDYLDRLGISGNMFNQYDLGSYIAWKCYPQRKVFIDGRNQLYPVSFYEEYLSVNTSRENLERVMDKYSINYILLLNQAPQNVYTFLSESDRWSLIYWDDLFLIYLRNTEENRSIIQQHEFKYYDPVLPPEATLLPNLQKDAKACLAELERVLALNPNCTRARLLLKNCKTYLDQIGIQYK